MSLSPKVDQTMAQAVISQRLEKAFHTSGDLQSIPGWEAVYPQISSEIGVRSNYFSMDMTGTFREARAMAQVVVKREGKRTRVLLWRSG